MRNVNFVADCTPVAPKRERLSPEKENVGTRTVVVNKRVRSPGREDAAATSSK